MIATRGNIIMAALFLFMAGFLTACASLSAISGKWGDAAIAICGCIASTAIGLWMLFAMRPRRPFYGRLDLEDWQ